MSQTIRGLGDFVRETRKSKNMSQEELVERIGVCKRTIIDIERNTGNPKFELLYLLVRELDLPLAQIFYPELSESIELKALLMQKISRCTEDEMKIIVAMVKSLKNILESEEKPFVEIEK